MNYMHYMSYGDNEGECFLKKEQPNNEGGYFVPLNKDRLYSKYLIDYLKDGVFQTAVAQEKDHGFEVVFGEIKIVFGLLNTKIFRYGGRYDTVDFKYGLVEVNIELNCLIKEGIVVLGCRKNVECIPEHVKEINLNVGSIFLSGGIGDIFAIDSLLTNEIKKDIKTIYYGTKHASIFQKLLQKVPEYDIKNHFVVWNESFIYKSEYSLTDIGFLESTDFGIFAIFPQVLSGHLHYNKSSWLMHKLCEIKVDLPEDYIVICPYTGNKSGAIRNFTDADWRETLNFLEKRNIKGVILNEIFDGPIPNHPNLIDYSSQTDILESIEILKKAKYYIGIDSCLSVLAAKLFSADHIAIKVIAKHPVNWKRVYWAPHVEFPFLKSIIELSHMGLA